MELLQEARDAGASLKRACEEIELNLRTYKRWCKGGIVQADKRPTATRPVPANKLSEAERQAILAVCNGRCHIKRNTCNDDLILKHQAHVTADQIANAWSRNSR